MLPEEVKHRRLLRFFGIAFALVILIYLGAFVRKFEIFSGPVRDDKHGWLGPVIRGDLHTVDIGKVYYYEGTSFSSYQMFRPLCATWLWVNGVGGKG